MKKLFILLFCFMSLGVQASVLLVKEYGVNNTYSTISAAIAASSNNDTILVYDKPSGQLWIENITIDKNLWIANAVDTARFKLQGNVTIVPKAGMQLYLLGYNLINGSSILTTTTGASATSSQRALIYLSDCIVTGSVNLDMDWIDAQVAYCNITGTLTLRHGAVLGNRLGGDITFNEESTTAAQNDSILVIGNTAPALTVATKEAGIISNNYFSRTNLAAVVNIVSHNPNDSAKFIISNNTILNSGNSGVSPLTCNGSTCGGGCTRASGGYSGLSCCLQLPKYTNTLVINNILGLNPLFSNGSTTFTVNCCCNSASVNLLNSVIINATGGSGQPLISHNIFANNFGTANSNNFINIGVNNEFNYYGNYSIFGSIDEFGRAVSGNSNCINKGMYLGEYYDVDLSRNDIGTYGGPYSIDNYLSTGNSKARVLFINIPHQLSNINQIINVKGSGGAKF